eukprot:gene2302-32_t
MPMGTNCAPDLANLYCYAIESKYIDTLPSDKAKLHANTRRFIDDILSFGIKPAPMELYHMKYKDTSISPTEVVFLGMRLTTNGKEIKIGPMDKTEAWPYDPIKYVTTKSNMPLHQGKGILKVIRNPEGIRKAAKHYPGPRKDRSPTDRTIQQAEATMSTVTINPPEQDEEAALCGLYAIRYALEYHGFKETIERSTLDTIAEGQQRILNETLENNVTVTDSAPQALDANNAQSTTVINVTDDIDIDDFDEESPHHPTQEAEQATTTPKTNEGIVPDMNEPDTTTKKNTRKKVNAINPIAFAQNNGWYQMEVIDAAIPMITQNKLQLSTVERTTLNQPFKHDCYLVITGSVGHYFTAMRCEDNSWQIRDNLKDNGNPIAI